MELSISLSVLKIAIARLDRVAQKNVTLPVLQCVLFETKKKELLLRATNLDIGAEITISAKIEKEGSVAVPVKALHGVLQTTTGDTVIIKENNGNLEIKTNKNKALLKCFPISDFPKLPTLTDHKFFSINIEKLRTGIGMVAGSSSTTDIKPELASIYIHANNTTLVFVATDSIRLAEQKISVKQKIDLGDQGLLIPTRNAQELIRFFENGEGDCDIRFNKNQLVCSIENILFTTRLIDAAFPDYEQIIPKQYTTEASIAKQDLLDALRFGTVFSNTYYQIVLSFDPKKKQCTIETKNSDVGEGTATIPATISGDPLEVSCNYRYLIEVLPNIPADHISVSGNGSDKPLLIRAAGSTAFTYLVMPMNR